LEAELLVKSWDFQTRPEVRSQVVLVPAPEDSPTAGQRYRMQVEGNSVVLHIQLGKEEVVLADLAGGLLMAVVEEQNVVVVRFGSASKVQHLFLLRNPVVHLVPNCAGSR
jgi:hypothetical protein